MPTPYDSAKTLADKLDLDYFRRPRGLTNGLRLLTWGTLLVCLLAVSYMLLPGKQRLVQAGPLSPAHAMFNNHCGHCHQETFRTATRIWQGDQVRSVPDSACLTCHPGPNHQEAHAGQAALTSEGCTACHKEHRGRTSLARVGDDHCVRCHADPAGVRPDAKLQKVLDFATHPEFALLRGKAADPGTIQFNHQAHLSLPPEARGLDKPLQRLRQQGCAFCHEPDAAGRYMQPVRYERHCRECHPLPVQVVGESLSAATKQFASQPAWHPGNGQAAGLVRADLRSRFIRFAQDNPKRVPPWLFAVNLVCRWPETTPAATLTALVQPLPAVSRSEVAKPDLPSSRRSPPATAEQLGWVDFQLWHAERALFDSADGCRRCHIEATQPFARPNGLPEYKPPRMNERWYTSSRFDHKSHRLLNCLECHPQAASSTGAVDIMLPGVNDCRRCHHTAGGARTDCVECHQFHHSGAAVWLGRFTIEGALDKGAR